MPTVFWKTVEFLRNGWKPCIMVARCAMYRRPTSPDEFARPSGCTVFAERRNSAAELTAPHDTTNSDAPILPVSPFRSTSTATTFRPEAQVIRRRAQAFVHNVTFGRRIAGRMQQTSASLFACSLHTNELHVLHRMHPSSSPTLMSPSGSGDGCRP